MLFAALLAAIWQFAVLQRSLDRQAVLQAAAFAQHDRLLQMVNEETGVRGYVATGDPVYLQIYFASLRPWLHDATAVAQTQTALPQLHGAVQRSIIAAGDVQQYFRDEIALMREGRVQQAKVQFSRGKRLFDRLRTLDDQVQDAADRELGAQHAHTRLLAQVGLVAAIAIFGILIVWTIVFAIVLRRARLYRLSSMRDSLTGAQNRRGAIAAIHYELGSIHQQSFGLVFIDLDGFKKINDVYGHATGDAILRGVTARLQGEVRSEDTVCRMGGDEFVCIIAAPASGTEVRTIGERLRRAVCQPYEIGEDSYVVGCSVGISMFPQHGETSEALLSRADSAMYAAKAGGGGVREATAVAHWIV